MPPAIVHSPRERHLRLGRRWTQIFALFTVSVARMGSRWAVDGQSMGSRWAVDGVAFWFVLRESRELERGARALLSADAR